MIKIKKRNHDLEFLGVKLVKVDDYFLLSKNEKLEKIVAEEWFKSFMNDLRELVGKHYPDFQIYLAYLDREKDSKIIGYVYVKKDMNKTDEEHSDIVLNKEMSELSEKYKQRDTLFVTLQASIKSFRKLKKGSVKEHFKQPVLNFKLRR